MTGDTGLRRKDQGKEGEGEKRGKDGLGNVMMRMKVEIEENDDDGCCGAWIKR